MRYRSLFFAAMVLAACLIAACGSAPAAPEPPAESTVTPVTYIFVQPDELNPPTVTPIPGNELHYENLLMGRPGQKTSEYDGVTIMFHKDAPKNKMVLINMDGLHRLLDYLHQQSKTKLVFILAPDDKEVQSPYDPDDDILVVQIHASVPAPQLTGSLVAAILKRGNLQLEEAAATAKAYAIYAAMRCVSPEGYQGMLLPQDAGHISDAEYQALVPALCGIEALLVYTDAIEAPATPQPVVPNNGSNLGG